MKGSNKVDNSLFKATLNIGASTVKQIIWYFVNIIFIKNSFCVFNGLKIFLLKSFGAKIGSGVVIKPGVNIKYPWKLFIGENSWIGEKAWIDNLATITIGRNVCISQGALLLTGNHNYKKIAFDLIESEINIEDGVWIGANSVVCPGVTCKSHSVLSVASVASGDMDEYYIYRGNPAVKVRERIIGT